MNINKLGRDIEAAHNNGDEIESFLEQYIFDGNLKGFSFLGEGETRVSLTDEKTVLKVAKNEYALTHNKLEKFILNEVKGERVTRHIPEYYSRSANYWVLNVEYVDGQQVDWDEFWKHPDILGFQELSLDQDLETNVLWSSKRDTWVVVDLGMCWEKEHLQEIIPLLRSGKSIEDFAE